MKKTSIIVVNYKTLDFLKKCIESVKKHTRNYELIIVDNGSNNLSTDEFIKANADQYIFNSLNVGFAKANNEGARIAEEELLCFLNSDTEVTKGWLSSMIKTMEKNPKCVAVGPLGNPKHKVLDGIMYSLQQYKGQYKEDTQVGFLSGFCLLIKSEIFERFEFDEDFELGLFEDNLLCE